MPKAGEDLGKLTYWVLRGTIKRPALSAGASRSIHPNHWRGARGSRLCPRPQSSGVRGWEEVLSKGLEW